MSWVGGDIPGLQAIGSTMSPAPGEIRDVVRALSSGTDTLVGDAGWSGDAADAFRGRWTTNAIQAGGLADLVGQVGTTIGTLADQLARLETDLQNAASDAAARGAQIGAQGEPLTLVITGNAEAPNVVAAVQAQDEYAATYAQVLQTAQGFRLQAADALSGVAAAIEPGPDPTAPLDQRVTVADYLRGLYAVPNERNARTASTAPQAIADAHDRLRDARAGLREAKAEYAAKGLTPPSTDPRVAPHSAARADIDAATRELLAADAGAGERPLSRLLNTKIGDAERLLPQLGHALPAELSFLKDIPVVDVAASAVVGEVQARDDIEKGWSPTEARVKDYGSAALGLAGGAAAVALAPEAAPVLAVAAGAGLVVVGVGDAAYQAFHEHWSEDIHEHGVVSGILHGTGNVAANTGGDLKDMATGVWHSVFG